MLILLPVLVVENSRRSLPTAPAESVIGSPEQLELFAADPEISLPARCVVALFADRAPAFAALRELRFGFGLVADTADHHSPRSRSARATARGSKRTHELIRKHGKAPDWAWR
jgi:hypothetical protein